MAGTDNVMNRSSGAVAWRAAVRDVFEAAMRDADMPGMVVALARDDEPPDVLVAGSDGAGMPLRADTLFPVASITKLATALAVLRLVAANALALDDPLARYLPEAAAAREGITLRTLLCHVAGLPGDLPDGAVPYTSALDWPTLASACLRTPPIEPARTVVSYSSVGSGLLAIVAERLTGMRFGTALADLVLDPLGIEGYLGDEPPRPPAWIIGDLGPHQGDELEPFNTTFWRSLALPWGGLVTTAVGALALARAFAGMPSGYLPPVLLAEATRDQTGGLSGRLLSMAQWPQCPWGLGVELRGTKDPHFVPAQASPRSFGHAGSSGCLAWVDPEAGVSWAILGTCKLARWGFQTMPAIGAAILA